ncbi:uncharacterized protein LOC115066672 isoform X2 [Bactrocera dorsalis]|nr:uncharacterized protein LOC115066672 isoform X2 [Bactrocera dorsalis]
MMEPNDIFNVTPPSTSTPKGLKRKKVQLSHNFYASSSSQVLTPHSQNMFCSEETATASEGLDANKDIMAKLDLILEKQLNLESRLDKLEENIINKTDVMAHHKIVRETKVLLKKVQQTVCRISGESCEDFHTELAVLMPMQTLDAVFDLEEKILEKNYEDAVITYLFTLKGTSGDIGEVMKRVFGDEVLSLFNWDGRCGKKSLSKLKIVSVALFEIFKLHGRIDFEREVRKSVEQSHNRQKQKRYLLNKKNL